MKNYDQFKKLKWFPLKHKNMISKLIQLVICLSDVVVLVLWTAALPIKYFLHLKKKKKKRRG